MRRAFPHKVKPVPCRLFPVDGVVEQTKQAPQGVSRSTRKSAAMLGLALSMGAASLFITRHDDTAAAAEARSAASDVTVTPSPSAASTSVADEVNVPQPAQVRSRAVATAEYTVQQGQTLWKLARRYNVSVDELAALNGMESGDTLRAGQVIRIPVSRETLTALRTTSVESATSAQSSSPVSASESDSFDRYAQEREEALNRLRQEREKLRNSLAELQVEESGNSIATEERVLSPSATEAVEPDFNQAVSEQKSQPVPTSAGLTYRVKPGDTLGAIARLHNVSQQTLIATNDLDNPHQLRVHQRLNIPTSATPDLEDAQPSAEPSLQVATSGSEREPDQFVNTFSQPTQLQPAASQKPSATHRVGPGDTVEAIARIYNVPKAALIEANQLQDPNLILVGQVLRIPARPSLAEAAPSAPTSTPSVAIASSSLSLHGIAPAPVMPAETATTIPNTVVPSLPTTSDTQTGSAALFSTEFIGLNPSVSENQPTTIPSTESLQPTNDLVQGGETLSNRYAEQLITEMGSLSEQFQLQQSTRAEQPDATLVEGVGGGSQPADVELEKSAISEPQTMPEVVRETTEVALLTPAERRAVEQARTAESEASTAETAETASDPSDPQLVAAAPLGSENYEPLMEPIVGRMVSPELPPLMGAEAYLPNGSAVFNGYIWPARGVFTSGYGWRWGRMHRGIDIAAPVGTPIHAAASGVVEYAGWNSGGYGYMVDIRHPDGSKTRYAHNSRLLVRVGQEVEQGDQISLMGSTGYSTGPHLHFEIHLPNQGTVNPMAMLPNR